LFLLLCFSHTYSKDKIILTGGGKIKGVITHIENNRVVIEKRKSQFVYTPEEVRYIEFDPSNIEIAKIIEQTATDFTYLDGQQDAELYHKDLVVILL
jgi:predicted nucleic-acid-binding Zn-ribbon protein